MNDKKYTKMVIFSTKNRIIIKSNTHPISKSNGRHGDETPPEAIKYSLIETRVKIFRTHVRFDYPDEKTRNGGEQETDQ